MIRTHMTSRPAASYAEALLRLAELQAQDGTEVNPVCATYALTHGHKTQRVLVYFHGYTNCPEQFRQLGAEFHARGYTVLVPRQPYHGLLNRLSEDQAKLKAEDLIESTNAAIDIACGLGDEVIVAGLSAGGVMAAWAAQFRGDIARAVVTAPSFGLPFVPPFVSEVGKATMQTLPNFFIWWDPRVKENMPDCPHAYPRWATRALAEIMRMGAEVRSAARTSAPKAPEVVVITNANDLAINNRMVYRLVQSWREHAPERIRTYEFAKEMEVFHDMIDPTQSRQRIDLVYPIWMSLVEGRDPATV